MRPMVKEALLFRLRFCTATGHCSYKHRCASAVHCACVDEGVAHLHNVLVCFFMKDD